MKTNLLTYQNARTIHIILWKPFSDYDGDSISQTILLYTYEI